MQTIKLSKRLAAAVDMVRAGKRVADVGCDHGKLCAYLVLSEKCPYAVATDIHALPLEKAKKLFAAHGIQDKTQAMVCDGLADVDGDRVDDVVIAGLGADVTAFIIENAAWLRDAEKHLVLVPSSHHERVRIWLYQNGFAIQRERAVYEAGHAYSVMSVVYTGVQKQVDAVFAVLGNIRDISDDDAKRYIYKEYAKAKKIAAALQTGAKADNARAVINYINKEYGLHDRCDKGFSGGG